MLFTTTLLLALTSISLAAPSRHVNRPNRAVVSAISNLTIFTPPRNAGWTDPSVLYARSVILPNGDLLATWENYSPEPPLVYFPIFRSQDAGKTWKEISRVRDTVNNWGLRYQPDLYVLPVAIGSFPAGTLLASGNSIPTDLSKSKIDVYASTDSGLTWKFASSVVSGGRAVPENQVRPALIPIPPPLY